MKIEPLTWGLGAVALGSVLLAHVDPWSGDDGDAGFVSTKSAARRVFDGLVDVPVLDATIELSQPGGSRVRIVPSPHGHNVEIDGVLAGPADPEAVEGIWASLRMATTLRAVADDAEVVVGSAGVLVVETGGRRYEVAVGDASSDGAGLYAVIKGQGAKTGESAWVVERELGLLLAQAPMSHVARRLLVVDPGQVTSLQLGDASLRRGADGLWRSAVKNGEATVTGLLSTAGVEAKLDRLLGVRVEPLVPDTVVTADPAAPSIELEAWGDRTLRVELDARDCATWGRQGAILISRGPGWPGCVDAKTFAPWPLPGAVQVGASSLVEPRLLPHGYGRVLRIEQSQPEVAALQRDGGGWRLETQVDGQPVVAELGNAEVFEWYEALHEAEVSLDLSPPTDLVWTDVLELRVDSTATLRVRCASQAQRQWCRRDEGPILELRGDPVRLSFGPDTFADRTLARLATENARSLEVTTVGGARQSAHFDMGVWRLDRPEHPDGDNALDEDALSGLLAALAHVRAASWTAMPDTDPQRTITVELIPSDAGAESLRLSLFEDCVAAVGDVAATLDPTTCTRLQTDLLVDDPLRSWLDVARSVEVTVGEAPTVRFEAEGERLVPGTDEGAEPAQALLMTLAAARYAGLGAGDPPDPKLARLRILPRRGAAFEVDVGEGWAQLVGADWWYRQQKAGAP